MGKIKDLVLQEEERTDDQMQISDFDAVYLYQSRAMDSLLESLREESDDS